MKSMEKIYGASLALHTDLYQLTMAYSYWKSEIEESEAVFHMFFRENPFRGGFTIACGLEQVIDYLEGFRFGDEDLRYLGELRGNDGEPLFDPAFLDYLGAMELACDIDAMPEGTVVFPHEPLLRVRGPITQCQIFETPLLNLVNFQSLVATKAARVALAARGEPVIEFGLRRAHGVDGALAASRASYVGGCAATSNLLAGKVFGIPVRGTHAHSWVMCFDTELEAFKAYARAMPNNCVFLVDTYDTLEGVRHAVEAGKWLRSEGHDLAGIRLDSGDLAYLSIEARKILDEAGFEKAAIVASNDLDERVISSLKEQGATISVWGVGTRLVTAYDQPALGGVYKLSAIRGPGGEWHHKIKLSEQAIKVSNPGMLQVRRFHDGSECVGDVIYDELLGAPDGPWTMVDPMDITRRKTMPAESEGRDLLAPIFRAGEVVYDSPTLEEMQRLATEQLEDFHRGIKRFTYPHQYPVGLEKSLHDLKLGLIMKARNEL